MVINKFNILLLVVEDMSSTKNINIVLVVSMTFAYVLTIVRVIKPGICQERLFIIIHERHRKNTCQNFKNTMGNCIYLVIKIVIHNLLMKL